MVILRPSSSLPKGLDRTDRKAVGFRRCVLCKRATSAENNAFMDIPWRSGMIALGRYAFVIENSVTALFLPQSSFPLASYLLGQRLASFLET